MHQIICNPKSNCSLDIRSLARTIILLIALIAAPPSSYAAVGEPLTNFVWHVKMPHSLERVWFEDYESACDWIEENFCMIHSLGRNAGSSDNCVSFEVYACTADAQFVQGRASGMMKYYTADPNDIRERSNGYPIWGESKQHAIVDVIDNPPPTVCVGDPIEVSTGRLYEKEIDIPSLGEGQVEFFRIYDSLNPQNVWNDNYSTTTTAIQTLDISQSEKFRFKTDAFYSPPIRVCDPWMGGWRSYPTAPWNKYLPLNIRANDYFCELMDGESVQRNLIIMRINPYTLMDKPELRDTIQLSRPDGSIRTFQKNGSTWTSNTGETAVISINQNGYWVYKDKGLIEEYSPAGKLISQISKNGIKQTLIYDAAGQLTQVLDSTGKKLIFSYLNGKVRSVKTSDNKVTSYEYNSLGMITSVTRPDNTHRSYLYEDIRHPKALTAILDERGIRYAAWTYDTRGRAVSSENPNGIERTLLAFNADGSTTVTNALNKKTIYRFDEIAGVRRVTKIEGQPTANCVGANQDYTYTPEGWIASKTDWKGIKTTYQYNSLGQEIFRTEAFGTTEARTVTTEWHPTLYLEIRITEPDKETTFGYDPNGRLFNQSVRSLIN